MKKLVVNYRNLGDLLEQSAAAYGDRPLFFFPDDNLEISYDEFNRNVNQAANMMRELGINRGDRVSVMLNNIVEFPIAWLAIARMGSVMVPVNNSYQSTDLKYVLNDSGARLIIIHHDYLPILEKIRSECPALKQVIVVGGEAPPDSVDFAAEMNIASDSFEGPEVDMDDLINIQYTSGTTGFPKGCMLTHKYWLQLGQAAADYVTIKQDDRDLCAQPFYYMDAQWNTVLCLMHGLALVVMCRFSSSKHWKVCKQYEVTFFYCIGTMPVYLAGVPDDPENEQQHNLRVVICSGIHPQLHEYFETRWNVPWREAFGMTETGVDLLVPLEDKECVGSGAMGIPIPSKEAKVVDENGNELPQGQTGQLIVRGEPMMLGYWNNPEATAEVIKNGWLHTGDLAYVDERGYFHWVGRIKDMVRRSGENISTAEVESVLVEHPKVKLAAVVPVPDPTREEEVKAYIVLKDGETKETAPPQELIDFAAGKLSAFKLPRYIEYRADLPRTPSERVEKHRLLAEKDDLRQDSYDAAEETWR